MKRATVLVLTILSSFIAVQAQTYLDPTKGTIPTPTDVTQHPCNPTVDRSLVFNFETLTAGSQSVDIAVGKTIWAQGPFFGDPLYYPFTYARNVNGNFPDHYLFTDWEAECWSPLYVKKFIFGKLRPNLNPPRRDMAVVMTGYPYRTMIFHNSLNPNLPLLQVQHMEGDGVDGAWGAFTSNDNLEDFAVTDPDNSSGPRIRIYRNTGNGDFDRDVFFTFPYRTTKIVLAQINGRTDDPVTTNKLDLVGIDGTQIIIWRNDDNNDFPDGTPYKQTINLGFGSTVTSFAVADIDNNGWNDIVVGSNQGVILFLNTANSNGDIGSAYWALSDPVRPHQVAVGDMGSPAAFGGAGRNDGWNDLIIADNGGPNLDPRVRIFINQKGQGSPPTYFLPDPQQVLYIQGTQGPIGEEEEAPCTEEDVTQMSLIDVQTNGGLSLVFTQLCANDKIHYFWHNGDPAPAPPQNVQVTGTPADEYGYRSPKITWAANSERDLSVYELWRKKNGGMNCSNQGWTQIASSISSSTTEYIDWSISTVMSGGDCTAEYTLRAKDAANNLSDYSDTVAVNFASWFWKPNGGDAGNIQVQTPRSFALHSAYPNPFNPSTQIKFDLPEDGLVTLNVFDVLGRKVAELANGNYTVGYHTTTWNAKGIASGVYLVRFMASDANGIVKYSKINKLILNK